MFCWPLADHPEMQRANSDDVSKIIRLLVDVNGVAYAGPHQCVRFACIGDATSYLCNEVRELFLIFSSESCQFIKSILIPKPAEIHRHVHSNTSPCNLCW